MPRNRRWNSEENELIKGVLEQYGDKPSRWPAEVKEMLRARLVDRTQSGIYQRALKLIKARKTDDTSSQTAEEQGFMSARGA